MTIQNQPSFHFATLETERLVLKSMSIEFKEGVYRLFSDDDVTRYMDMESIKTMDEAVEIIEFMSNLAERKLAHRWVILWKETNEVIGTCGFNNWERHRGSRSEIGYDLAKEFWGKGIMKEALTCMLTFGFQEMNLRRIEALVLGGAKQSMRVLEKLGFVQEGLLRQYGYWSGQFWDEHMFSLIRGDAWTANL